MPTPIRKFRISNEEWEAVQVAASRRGETVSDAIRRALAEYVETTNKTKTKRGDAR